ncbi:hypothetical protein BKA69DRAFT_1124713 [Paraphysoderma sedebokerense]|nr:hypothetical protein BKA69DRAFT_1124713 [Paraphysoderma sedebokerense]
MSELDAGSSMAFIVLSLPGFSLCSYLLWWTYFSHRQHPNTFRKALISSSFLMSLFNVIFTLSQFIEKCHREDSVQSPVTFNACPTAWLKLIIVILSISTLFVMFVCMVHFAAKVLKFSNMRLPRWSFNAVKAFGGILALTYFGTSLAVLVTPANSSSLSELAAVSNAFYKVLSGFSFVMGSAAATMALKYVIYVKSRLRTHPSSFKSLPKATSTNTGNIQTNQNNQNMLPPNEQRDEYIKNIATCIVAFWVSIICHIITIFVALPFPFSALRISFLTLTFASVTGFLINTLALIKCSQTTVGPAASKNNLSGVGSGAAQKSMDLSVGVSSKTQT